MTKLRCCFCQQELKYDAWNEVYMCRNPNCKHLLGFGTKELWQELIKLMEEKQHANTTADQQGEVSASCATSITSLCAAATSTRLNCSASCIPATPK